MDTSDLSRKQYLSHLDLESSSVSKILGNLETSPRAILPPYSRSFETPSRNYMVSKGTYKNQTVIPAAMRRTSLPAISVQRPVSSQVRTK